MTPLQWAKKELLGRDVVCAIGTELPPVPGHPRSDELARPFKGHLGQYVIVGLTGQTVIVAPIAIDGSLNTTRRVSIRIDSGDSRKNCYGVFWRLRSTDLEMVRKATAPETAG